MTPEEQLDEARAEEAYRQWQEEGCQGDDTIDVAAIAARLAREGWTPPEPVDPDILAFREWAAKDWVERYPAEVDDVQRGKRDGCDIAKAYLAGSPHGPCAGAGAGEGAGGVCAGSWQFGSIEVRGVCPSRPLQICEGGR